MYILRIYKCNNRRSIIDWENIIVINSDMPVCELVKGHKDVKKWFADEVRKVKEFTELKNGYYAISFVSKLTNTTSFELRIKNNL